MQTNARDYKEGFWRVYTAVLESDETLAKIEQPRSEADQKSRNVKALQIAKHLTDEAIAFLNGVRLGGDA